MLKRQLGSLALGSLALIATAAVFFASASPASAHSANLTNSKTGQVAAIQCRNSGCSWNISGGGKPSQNRTGPGGKENFDKVVARLKSQGFK